MIGTYDNLDDAGRAELDRSFLEFATRRNTGTPGGPAAVPVEYLLIVGSKRP